MIAGLADEPRWVEAHGIAADPAAWRRDIGGGFAVGSAQLIVCVGVEAAAIHALAAEFPAHALLVEDDRAGGERAIIHTLPEPEALFDLDGAVRLTPDAPLDHVRPAVRAELAAATGPVWCVWVDDQPVAFAYAVWRSDRWFDINVDVEPGARQLGLGQIVATALIRDERAAGREPVWGADENNHASLALARRLGFVASAELWVIAPRAA